MTPHKLISIISLSNVSLFPMHPSTCPPPIHISCLHPLILDMTYACHILQTLLHQCILNRFQQSLWDYYKDCPCCFHFLIRCLRESLMLFSASFTRTTFMLPSFFSSSAKSLYSIHCHTGTVILPDNSVAFSLFLRKCSCFWLSCDAFRMHHLNSIACPDFHVAFSTQR